MDLKTTTENRPRLFQLTAVEDSPAPAGADGDDWFRYTLTGNSVVTGYRRGSRRDVTRYAKSLAERLNERLEHGLHVYAPRKRK